MKTAIRIMLLIAVSTQFLGCSIRILTFGIEESNTDREYMLGHKRDTITKQKDK